MHLVFTTVAKKKDADKIAGALVSLKLAACVSSWPVHSTYKWMGKIKREREYAIEIKTANGSKVRKWLEKNHPYKVPVIYGLETNNVSAQVKRWISEKQV